MNFSTLIGLLASLAVFGGALYTSTNNLGIFFDTHAILIVLGGTVAASLVCFSLPKVVGLFRVFVRRMLGQSRVDYQGIITEITQLSQAARKGKASYEASVRNIKNLFLRDAAEVLFWAEADISAEQLKDLLETRAETHFERYLDEANIFRTMSKFPPAFGLMGTTLGMIVLLQSLGTENAKDTIGPAMSIALVATLYGIVFSNFFFIPIAENLTKQTKEDLIARRMVVEGIMLIHADVPTKYVEEKIKSFLLPSERGPDRAIRERAIQP